MKHPSEVLHQSAKPPAVLPVCDHYAGSEKLMQKSLERQAQAGPLFDVTLDCEDGATVGREAEHAEMAARLAASDANRHGRVGVRVHDVNHPSFINDLDILIGIAGPRLAYITVPKVNSANDALNAAESIERIGMEMGLDRKIPVHVLIETHGALREVFRIAAHPAIECLSFGLMDFVSSHHGAIPAHALTAEGQFDHPLIARAKLEIAAACHAYGKVPSHNVVTELNAPDVISRAARRAGREFGYTRMWSIHPSQIDPIVEALSPSAADAADAERILLAAARADWGPIRDGDPQAGRLHDRASYRYYWDVLRRAHAAGVDLSAEARRQFFS
ncbi:aldolase/citrate lyase family protein [Pigmentiphaga sp.]|uniref:HpcH/HpaI aldolase/citrate lyase family protein n=1 Tax=Pigmentiphaga sp. TaxID=1977564 RepID=UPI0025F5DA6D|nr:aldolase/citrate lyase family protein [Pigmentiphaga sp.]